MVCLDSDIIINALRNRGAFGKKIVEMKRQGISLSTTTITTFELLRGVKEERKEKETASLYNFLSGVAVRDFDFKSSERAALIFNTLKEQGNLVDLADIMIAAICIENHEPLLTENKKHFERIKELELQEL